MLLLSPQTLALPTPYTWPGQAWALPQSFPLLLLLLVMLLLLLLLPAAAAVRGSVGLAVGGSRSTHRLMQRPPLIQQ